ncbi:MAG: hypothetical protein K8F91_01595 [Candidatus Obscuribacterales bacterium]|nr:hypothetical protein [Candidatus Obscuribacterales bacterium]
MRISALFLGVNVAATLSVALQVQAQANEGQSKVADFLKSSLSELNATAQALPDNKTLNVSRAAPYHALVTPSKVSISSPKSVASRAVLSGKPQKMMPFVPGRKLPSKQDLLREKEIRLQAAIPQMAPGENVPMPLKGEISQYSNFYLSTEIEQNVSSATAKRAVRRQVRRAASDTLKKAAEVASAYVHQTSPQIMPGQSPVVAGQVGHPCASLQSLDCNNHDRLLTQPTTPHLNEAQGAQMPLLPPHLTAQEHAQLDRIGGVTPGNSIQSPLMSHMVSKERMDGLYSRVGPPPFPLNMVPEPMMKEFLGQARNRKSMISTYPGAFAAPAPGLSGSGSGSGFPSFARSSAGGGSGFQSFAHKINGFGHYGHSAKSTSRHLVASSARVRGHSGSTSGHGHYLSNKHAASSVEIIAHKASARVAVYPPYSSNLKIQGL